MAALPQRLDARSIVMLLALSVLWGGSFFFAGAAVRELPPLTIVLARVALAAVMLLPVLWISGHVLPRGVSGWVPFMVMGLLNNVIPFSLIVMGQTRIASGLASVKAPSAPRLPYTSSVETCRKRRTPARRAASRRTWVPTTFVRQSCS